MQNLLSFLQDNYINIFFGCIIGACLVRLNLLEKRVEQLNLLIDDLQEDCDELTCLIAAQTLRLEKKQQADVTEKK